MYFLFSGGIYTAPIKTSSLVFSKYLDSLNHCTYSHSVSIKEEKVYIYISDLMKVAISPDFLNSFCFLFLTWRYIIFKGNTAKVIKMSNTRLSRIVRHFRSSRSSLSPLLTSFNYFRLSLSSSFSEDILVTLSSICFSFIILLFRNCIILVTDESYRVHDFFC